MRASLLTFAAAAGLLAGCQALGSTRWDTASLVDIGPTPAAPETPRPDRPLDEVAARDRCEALEAGTEAEAPEPAGVPPAEPVKAPRPVLVVLSAPREAAATPPVPMTDLAHAAYITEIGGKTKTLAELTAAVSPPPGDDPRLDYLTFDRTLAIAVHRSGFRPADRLAHLEVKVRPLGFEFGDAKLATTFADADLGHLSRSVSASGTLAAAGPSASGGAAVSETRSFEKGLRERFQDADITVQPHHLGLYREAAPGLDLTGSYEVPVTFSALRGSERDFPVVTAVQIPEPKTPNAPAASPHRTARSGAGRSAAARRRAMAEPPRNPAAPGPAAPLVRVGLLRTLAAPLWVCARLSYVERRVVRGQAQIDEARQTVVFVRGATRWRPYEVLAPEELEPPRWRIVMPRAAPDRTSEPSRPEFVTVSAPGRAEVSDFLSWKDAEALRDALAAGRRGEFPGEVNLPPGDPRDLRVEVSPAVLRDPAPAPEPPYRKIPGGPLK